MSFKFSFGSRWIELRLWEKRFTVMVYCEFCCGHNSTRNLVTMCKTKSGHLLYKFGRGELKQL